jgi:hypothetical protein
VLELAPELELELELELEAEFEAEVELVAVTELLSSSSPLQWRRQLERSHLNQMSLT